ncbi:MAG TPA: 3-hydroxyacyl-CoA dehydrogenase NAD-binding domain-containing protein, partial [Puia sp.]|nr:3-hydroxyacyl-CoA dehydrogenase NAD-binding domain-containing protein [Puia sp.]
MDKIVVIGAGTMGNGIAHVFAQYTFPVYLVDLHAEQLEKALTTISKNLDRQVQKGILSPEEKINVINRIHPVQNIRESVQGADFIIEAATENENVKLRIFKELDEYASPAAILASNTSSISITRIAAVTKRPTQVIGMHFMNPVPLMKLVEVINGYATAGHVTEKVIELTKKLDKTPCVVKDYPGFISNRLLMPMINEAIISLQEGVASAEAIDTVMKLGMAHPMGPLQLADFIGLDVCLAIMKVLQEGFGNPKYAPATLLVNMVA